MEPGLFIVLQKVWKVFTSGIKPVFVLGGLNPSRHRVQYAARDARHCLIPLVHDVLFVNYIRGGFYRMISPRPSGRLNIQGGSEATVTEQTGLAGHAHTGDAHGYALRHLLVRVLVNYQLLAPYGEHWVYDTPLFGLCLEATRNTGNSQWGAHMGDAGINRNIPSISISTSSGRPGAGGVGCIYIRSFCCT